MFREMVSRYPTVDIVGDTPRHRDRLAFRGVATVELAVGRHSAGPGAPVRPTSGDLEWRRRYREHLDSHPRPVDANELAGRVRLLASNEFFAGCTGDELASLAETAYPLAFDAGEWLVRQGERSPDAFVIAEGTADVVIDGEVVATLDRDSIVGERGVLTGATAPRPSRLPAISARTCSRRSGSDRSCSPTRTPQHGCATSSSVTNGADRSAAPVDVRLLRFSRRRGVPAAATSSIATLVTHGELVPRRNRAVRRWARLESCSLWWAWGEGGSE